MTTFATVTILLKPSSITERFPISIVLDRGTKLPIVTGGNEIANFRRDLNLLPFTQQNVMLSTSQEIIDSTPSFFNRLEETLHRTEQFQSGQSLNEDKYPSGKDREMRPGLTGRAWTEASFLTERYKLCILKKDGRYTTGFLVLSGFRRTPNPCGSNEAKNRFSFGEVFQFCPLPAPQTSPGCRNSGQESWVVF